MNPEKQRIAIAEASGWRSVEHRYNDGSSAGKSWVAPDGVGRNLPDYPNDLNAMHEAEKTLTYEQLLEYTCNIGLIHTQTTNRNDWDFVAFVHIPANERAEAFCRTIGKWEDE